MRPSDWNAKDWALIDKHIKNNANGGCADVLTIIIIVLFLLGYITLHH